MNALKPVLQLFTPKFYCDHFWKIVNNTRKDFIAGSPAPLFKGMLLVGVVGYAMEYSMVGRYHVIEKQEIIKKALADHHH
eukprot:gene11718-13608_t